MAKVPFPHMMHRDVPLFAAYALTPDARRFSKWEFDVQVGNGHLTQSEFNPRIFQTAYDVSKLRIDVVGWEGSFPTIFEVKPRAHVSALGQVAIYQYYFGLQFGIQANLAIITNWSPPDIMQYCAAKGIRVYTVSEATEEEILAACRIVQADCSQLIRLPIVG